MYKHVFASVYKCVCLLMQTCVITRALYLASDVYCTCIYVHTYVHVCPVGHSRVKPFFFFCKLCQKCPDNNLYSNLRECNISKLLLRYKCTFPQIKFDHSASQPFNYCTDVSGTHSHIIRKHLFARCAKVFRQFVAISWKCPTLVGNSCTLVSTGRFSPKWFPIIRNLPSL